MSNNALLVGRDVKVCSNEFIQMDLVMRIAYISEHSQTLLLEFSDPINISGVTYTHAVAAPRLARDDLNVLLTNGVLGCAITWVPKERFDQSKPLDLTWWRGGAAAITDVMFY